MSDKAHKLLLQAKEHVSEEIYRQLAADCEGLGDKPTPAKQAKCAAAMLARLSAQCDDLAVERIMQSCNCLSDGTIKKAQKLYAQSADFEEFLDLLNQAHIGGGKLHLQDRCVIGIYDHCYCGLAKSAKNLPASYCHCSAGWFKRLFSSVLEREIEVKMRHTILGGAEACVFEIFV